ncbi:hypothetical protein Neosp_005763 [[Neocosmospora] mangrovei]
MKMRTSLFCALQGLGVVAHESLAYFKADHSNGGHRYLDGCGKAGKGNWVPDPATFVLPQNDFKPSDHWGLCASGHDCAPHEATGKVYFDFQDDGLVFNFEAIDHYKYGDVSIYVERARPPHAHSTKYNKDSDHCKAKNGYKEVKCHIPYFSLTDGGSYDKMCPLKGEGGWRFYIKIKATIVHGDKRYELYNRESTNGEKYFALSYTCGKCKHHKHDPKIELINAATRRDEGSEHKHHEGHHDGKRNNLRNSVKANALAGVSSVNDPKLDRYVQRAEEAVGQTIRKAVDELDDPSDARVDKYVEKAEAVVGNSIRKAVVDIFSDPKKVKAALTAVSAQAADPVVDLTDVASGTGHGKKIKHVKIDKREASSSGSSASVYSDAKVEKTVEKAVEQAAARIVENLDNDKSKSHHTHHHPKRSVKFYNGYQRDCEGKLKKVYAIDERYSHDLKKLSYNSHPNTCQKHDGHYLRYQYEDLKSSVSGKLINGHDYHKHDKHDTYGTYGKYYIELVKKDHHNEIIVSIDLKDNYEYTATKAAVFVGCDGGQDSYDGHNICHHKSYPYQAVQEKGLNEFSFAIKDKYQCRGDYYIGIYVELCDKNGDCGSCSKGRYNY